MIKLSKHEDGSKDPYADLRALHPRLPALAELVAHLLPTDTPEWKQPFELARRLQGTLVCLGVDLSKVEALMFEPAIGRAAVRLGREPGPFAYEVDKVWGDVKSPAIPKVPNPLDAAFAMVKDSDSRWLPPLRSDFRTDAATRDARVILGAVKVLARDFKVPVAILAGRYVAGLLGTGRTGQYVRLLLRQLMEDGSLIEVEKPSPHKGGKYRLPESE